MNSGSLAEQKAAIYLKSLKYRIIEMNWTNSKVEIDIIAQKNKTVYFIEVKYRKSNLWGDGLDYIDSSKVERLKKGVEYWSQQTNYSGSLQIAGIAVSGNNYTIDKMVLIDS